MKRFYQKGVEFIQRPFIRDTLTLQAGTVVSTGLSFVASLVYARVLGAELYGTYSLIFAFAGIVAVFFDWGATYSTITLLSEAVAKGDRSEIRHILGYYLKLSFVVSVIVGGAAILLAPFISRLAYGRSDVGALARWVILAQAVAFLFVFFTLVLQSLRRMHSLTILENVRRFFEKALPIFLVLFGFGVLGIVTGYLVADLLLAGVALALYARFSRTSSLFPRLSELFRRVQTFSVRRYFWFGFQIAIDKNLGDVMNFLPVLLLGAFASRETVGHFRIALAYITLPLLLLSATLPRLLAVYFPQLKATADLDRLQRQFWKVSLVSTGLAAFLVIPFVLLGPFLVRFFYGEAFRPAIPLIYWFIPYPIILAAGVGLGPIFRTLNQVKVAIWINGATLLGGLPIVYFLIRNFGAKGVIVAVLFWAAISTIAALWWVWKVFKKERHE